MQTKISDTTELMIPRYLGLAEIHRNGEHFDVILGYSSKTKKELQLDEEGLQGLQAFLRPNSAEKVARELGICQQEANEFCQYLYDEGILRQTRESGQFARYDRHMLFYDLQGENGLEVQKRLSSKSIALVGMGGIGCWSSINLIGAGFKELRLIDFDTIEISNLTRQILFKEEDVGALKGEVAKRELQARNKETKVNFVELKVDGEDGLRDALAGVDFVIVSADTPVGIHNWVDHVCFEHKIPYLNVGYRDGVGVVGPLTEHGKTSCYECFKKKGQDEVSNVVFSNFYGRYQAPSFGPLNAMASTMACMEVIKYFAQMGELLSFDSEINIDPMTMELSFKKYSRDEHCWQCGDAN